MGDQRDESNGDAKVMAKETTVVMATAHEVRGRQDAGCMRCMVRMRAWYA